MRKAIGSIATLAFAAAFGIKADLLDISALAAGGTAKTITVANGEELAAAVKSICTIRAANRDVPVEILLASGDYDVPSEITMREGRGFVSSVVAPVTIRAAPGAKPRLCGGRVVKGWKRTSFNGRNGVWVADVSAMKLKAQLPLLFHNGVSMALCRRPNADPGRPYSGGWAYVPGKAVNMYKNIEGARDDEVPVRPEDWVDRARIDEGRICIFPRFNWWNKVLPIASCDPTNHTLRLSRGIGKTFDPRANDRYHLMGYREDLDAPGEWYHDLAGGKVYFIPPDGSDPNSKRTAVVADESLSVFHLDCVTNVVIKGLEICEASAGVRIIRSDRCEVVACSLHDIGFFSGNAVGISGTRCAVRDCDVWNIGAYGIQVSGVWGTRYAPDTRDGNVVENNYIHHTGLVNRHGFGVHVAGQGSRVSHNLIHDMPRGGIFYSGRFLTIDRNRIRHVNLEMEDTAAIYGGGYVNNIGTRIEGNWVSHSIGFSHDKDGVYSFRKTCAWGIYLDDCSGGATVCGNLVNHCNGGAMHMHCARFNVVSNNVFVSNGGKSANPRQFSINGWKATDKGLVKTYLPTRAQEAYERLIAVSPAWTNFPALAHEPKNPDAPGGYIMQGNRIVNNIWYYPNQPESFLYTPGNYNVSNNVFDANIIWNGSGTVKIVHEGKEITFEQWCAMGQERSSVLANPLFKDPKHGDWSFREGSPALALGMAPIHPEEAGLYLNENRTMFPKEAEGAREHPEWTSNLPMAQCLGQGFSGKEDVMKETGK